MHFKPTRDDGLRRLRDFAPSAGLKYAQGRNYDRGSQAHYSVSQLSPYVRRRVVSETEILQTVLGAHSTQSAEKFIQEVFWRTYWKGWLELRPSVWANYQTSLGQVKHDVMSQGGLRQQWEAACYGTTGIDCFDHWSKELVETGYLHNHARMWFASIWVHTLELPWELGADFFMRHLMDGDPASNTLSWRWVCGLHTAGKTYLARPDNIEKFTEGRFRPTGLATYARPLGQPDHPRPIALALPRPVDLIKQTGLLLHDDDFDLTHVFANAPKSMVSAAYMPTLSGLSPWHMSDHVTAFVDGIYNATRTRYADRMPDINTYHTAEDVVTWARTQNLEQVVIPTPSVGPARMQMNKLEAELKTSNIHLCEIRAPYDTLCWPKATHGFFRFKENIPKFIETLRLK